MYRRSIVPPSTIYKVTWHSISYDSNLSVICVYRMRVFHIFVLVEITFWTSFNSCILDSFSVSSVSGQVLRTEMFWCALHSSQWVMVWWCMAASFMCVCVCVCVSYIWEIGNYLVSEDWHNLVISQSLYRQ